MNQSNNQARIKSIRITNLFGIISEHHVELKEGGITFIHGPNGCGKTTVLKLIDAVFNWNPTTLNEIDFEKIEFTINENDILIFYKQTDGSTQELPSLIFRYNDKEYSIRANTENLKFVTSEIEEAIPELIRIGPREWYDRNLGIQMDSAEVMKRYAIRFAYENVILPDEIRVLLDTFSLHFIKTQRLLIMDTQSSQRRARSGGFLYRNVIQAYSYEILSKINDKLADHSNVSQARDGTFPQRLLLKSDQVESEDEIRNRYAETERKIQRLVAAGLIDKQESIALPSEAFEDTERRVLTLYLEDTKEKLAVFDDLQEKIETFLEIINAKFRSKKISVNREKGFCIHMTKDQVDVELSPTQLSSGEQHQIVLFYELIFKSSENTFFLIDEPEISLHIDWQRLFIEDLKKIAKLGNRQFLIATHSPQIIGNNRDLAVALEDGILD